MQGPAVSKPRARRLTSALCTLNSSHSQGKHNWVHSCFDSETVQQNLEQKISFLKITVLVPTQQQLAWSSVLDYRVPLGGDGCSEAVSFPVWVTQGQDLTRSPISQGTTVKTGNVAQIHLSPVTAPSGRRQRAPGSQGALKVCNIFDEGNSDCYKKSLSHIDSRSLIVASATQLSQEDMKIKEFVLKFRWLQGHTTDYIVIRTSCI